MEWAPLTASQYVKVAVSKRAIVGCTIGIDIAKNVFQFQGVNGSGAVVLRRKVRRSGVLDFLASLPACLVAMAACATAHHWDRDYAQLIYRMITVYDCCKLYIRFTSDNAAYSSAHRTFDPYSCWFASDKRQPFVSHGSKYGF